MRKPLPLGAAIRRLRKDLGLTQDALAEKAEISVHYVRAIEAGFGAASGTISDEVKERLARALNISVWALFPEVKREVDLYNVLVNRHGKELVIRDVDAPGARAEVPMFKEVLSGMSEDEFDELISSGTEPADVHRIIRRWAKAHGIEVIK
jgi:transcriptional regulator with XRE-family HTH domain